MKKLLIFLILIILFVSSSYAQERTSPFSAAKVVGENKATIKTLANDVRDNTMLIKEKIQLLSDNNVEISTEQLETLKNYAVLITDQQEAMKATLGQINAYTDDILIARQVKDFDALFILYNEIIKIQTTRIHQLTEYNQLLDDLFDTL
ncbi:MAG: hypothetical protein CVU84_09255 [Firmicutes bacterium HGW-Firmicutes-1]|jgi:hypothetical protein|nr:MAG: hypothetical protein CVU84_09255 [Firmicutes bacterium HGW-Firmicutes-1]